MPVQKDILCLDIPMHNALIMQVRNSNQNGLEELLGLPLF
mgnify:FL=1